MRMLLQLDRMFYFFYKKLNLVAKFEFYSIATLSLLTMLYLIGLDALSYQTEQSVKFS